MIAMLQALEEVTLRSLFLVEVSKIGKSETRVRTTSPNHNVVGNKELKSSAGDYRVNRQLISVAPVYRSKKTTSRLVEDLSSLQAGNRDIKSIFETLYAAEESNEMAGKELTFVNGLHRSVTPMKPSLLKNHPKVTEWWWYGNNFKPLSIFNVIYIGAILN